MAQAGIIKTITGIVSARTPDGQIRQLAVGDVIYENDIIETTPGSELSVELNDGRMLNLSENSQVVIDETVLAAVAPQDTVVAEVQELQAALEAGEEIPDEETAAGEEDPGHNYDLAYDAGDQSGGDVGSYLFGTAYGGGDDDFPDIDGEEEEEEVPPPPEPPPVEPEPVFILGSSPEGNSEDDYSEDDYNEGQERYRPLLDDIEGTSETDHHTVNPAGENIQGDIPGQDGADILVGDPGSVTPEHLTNYILILDYSFSVAESSSFNDLLASTKFLIQTLYDRIEQANDGYQIKIGLLPFAGEADYNNNSAWISFTNQDGTVGILGGINSTTGTDSILTIEEIINWIDTGASSPELGNTGRTNYNSAFTEAQNLVDNYYNENNVIFMSDGTPNTGGEYSGAQNMLEGMVDSIRSVGIAMSIRGEARMDAIDTTGDAVNIGSDPILDVVVDVVPQDYHLDPTGSDNIYGNEGDDLIFGDVLNTDGVFADIAADHDLSGITEPPDGSGWEVFEILEENELSNWTRADTIQYILENHETLAEESVQENKYGQGYDDTRWGGYDNIEGGDGDDIIYGQEGDDIIDAGSGDDVVDGGSGFDTLVVTSQTELDFSNVVNIERIAMSEEDVDQTTTLSLDQVLSMTDEDNTLQITGEAGDSVTLTGVDSGDWTHDGNGLFTNVADNSIQITIEAVNDGVDIDVDVDNGDSFQI